MSKRYLRTRPLYRRQRDSIEAHLTIMFADLAASRWIEQVTGPSRSRPRFWMNLQARYNLEVERDRLGAALDEILPLSAAS
jgi:hypothetical protein